MSDYYDKYSAIVKCSECGRYMDALNWNLKRKHTCDFCLAKRTMKQTLQRIKQRGMKPSKKIIEMCKKYGVAVK